MNTIVRTRAADPSQADDTTFPPIQVCEVEVSQPIPALPLEGQLSGQRYRRGLILVRLHDQPVGVLQAAWGEQGLASQAVAGLIWKELAPILCEHLAEDGLPVPETLGPGGLPSLSQPRCIRARQVFLENAPFASVVIATHNRTDSLALTLQSLLAMEYPRFEIIVVDNAPSSNQTAEFIRSTYGGSGQIKYVREPYPGLSIAHNRGLREVNAPYVAFTDDDVQIDRHWLTEMMRGFRAAGQVACVTGMIYPAELETPAQEWIEQYGGFSKGVTRQVFDLGEHRVDSPLYPFAAGWFGSGASMAFDTRVLRELGGFDPATGAGTLAQGGDDLSAFFQVIDSGYRLVYHPAAILHHWHRREYAGLRRQAYGYGVGLTAYLTKAMLDHPRRILTLAARIPQGLSYLFGKRSRKNAKKQAGYPSELNRLELRGMLYGPVAYLRSRRRARQAGLYPTLPSSRLGLDSAAPTAHRE